MRTRLAGALVGATLTALLAALALRNWSLILLALPPLAFLAMGSLEPPGEPAVTVARTLSRDRLSVGSELEVRLAIRNGGPSLALLEVLDGLPPEFVLVRGTNHLIASLPDGESLELVFLV